MGSSPRSGATRRAIGVGAAGLLVAAGLVALLGGGWWRRPPSPGGVAEALVGQERVLLVGGARPPVPLPEGVAVVLPSSSEAIRSALDGTDPAALDAALAEGGITRVLVDATVGGGGRGDGATLGDRLAGADHVPGLLGDRLDRRAHVYRRPSTPPVPPHLAPSLAVVARALLAGARPPRFTSFPEPFRAPGNVEVMVMLRERGNPRLWRSARGSSIARGLVTAALVAKRRWTEREQAMGGQLDRRLPGLDVEVALLREDGTLVDRSRPFIDRMFAEPHGVAYERKGAWRYLLPLATREAGDGSAARAYEALFAQHGLPEDSFDRPDLRLYRLVVDRLAVSPAPDP